MTGDNLDAPVLAPTVCEAFQRTVALHGERVALRTRDDSVALTWSELGGIVERAAAALDSAGIRRGDTVAAMLPNIPECHIFDYAAMHIGAVPFTIYNTSSAEQIVHQLTNADCRLILTQDEFLPRVLEAKASAPDLEQVIALDGEGGTEKWEEFLAAADDDFDFDAAWRSVDAEALVALIFTSGTSGPPKGVQWAHRTVMAHLCALGAALPLPSENLISYMPMAHAGGRLVAHYLALPGGATITCCPDIRQMPECVAEVHPDSIFTPTRFWEKLKVAVEDTIDALEPGGKQEALSALEDGARRAQAGEIPPTPDALRPLLERVGLDRLTTAVIGGAPSPPELSEYFRAFGVPLLEGYGQTETTICVFNRLDDFRGGTAGKPLPGVELQLADDGEILIRGDTLMVGYRKNPELTAETIGADGWLCTGDIGSIDQDGFLSIVDRKKEIIISAAGKNMSPAYIEQTIKAESSLLGQVVVIGDGRRYNTALVTLDPEVAATYAKRLGREDAPFDQIVADPAIMAEVEAAIERGNRRLARVETIKKFDLLPCVWAPDSDELTPVGKLKRKPIERKYAQQIELLYAERPRPPGDRR